MTVGITEFFADKDILITGGTGFVGKVLIETLLRTCPQIGTIFVLIRPDESSSPHMKLASIVNSELFKWIREKDEKQLKKLVVVCGDTTKERLGLGCAYYSSLAEKVSVIFHSAADIRFNISLASAVRSNVMGTDNMVQFAKACTNLKAFLYVSTAFCNFHRHEIFEKIYNTSISPREMINMVQNNQSLDCYNQMIKDYPNVYLFTKSLSEELVGEAQLSIPVAIVRPSSVSSVYKGHAKEWTQGLTVLSGGIIASAKGLMFNLHSNDENVFDVIPVDYVVNCIIAAAWKTATIKNNEMVVYNIVSSPTNGLSYKLFGKALHSAILQFPPYKLSWYPSKPLQFHRNKIKHRAHVIVKELIPALLLDLFALVTWRQTGYFSTVCKVHYALDIVDFALNFTPKFHNTNTTNLFNSLSSEDKELFYFDVNDIDWEEHMHSFYLGLRKYNMKEDISNLPLAKENLKRKYWMNQIFRVACLSVLVFIVISMYAMLKFGPTHNGI